ILLTLSAIIGVLAYHLLSDKTVDLKANKKLAEKVSNGKDIKQAAFDSISDALADSSAKPPHNAETVHAASEQSPAIPHVTETNSEKVAVPIQSGISATLAPPPEALLTKRSENSQPVEYAAKTGSATNTSAASATGSGAFSKPIQIHSIRYAPTARPREAEGGNGRVTEAEPLLKTNANKTASQNSDSAKAQQARLLKYATKPSFGAMLPVRLLGVLYTLRVGSMARLELVRDLKTDHWQLKRGTIFIGSVVGGNLDRAYLQIKGYIDPDTQSLIKLEGEVLGNDGGAGLRGKQRQVSSVWVKVLDRAAQAGIQIGTSILNRSSSAVIVATDPYGTYRSTTGLNGRSEQNRNFVEVPAGAVGFVLVTALPESEASSPQLSEATTNAGSLNDTELVELMTDADPVRIRAAMSRMSPDLQRVAQAVLNEIESGKR
ncbi:MAG: hypothetical protein ABIP14_11590, partial [Blastocatellia bacterium]